MKERIVVVCPGRGTYTKETLGYLRTHGESVAKFVMDLDQRRKTVGEPTVSQLDQMDDFQPQLHTRGEHASALIYACAYADFMSIDRDRYEIVAITGNSMGWYLTAAFGGALDWGPAFEVIQTMGSMMKEQIVGGQVIYPICDENWRPSVERQSDVENLVNELLEDPEIQIYPSIFLGGYIVLGANEKGIRALLKSLPKVENYPLQLINHAAFHTPLLTETAHRAFELLPEDLFSIPHTPLVDGRGHIWRPQKTLRTDLYHYTLGHQVVEPYDFTKAVGVSLKEFAPDRIVLLGPGSNLGGSIGQILVELNWKGIHDKAAFSQRQAEDPFVLAMGRPDQRSRLNFPYPAR